MLWYVRPLLLIAVYNYRKFPKPGLGRCVPARSKHVVSYWGAKEEFCLSKQVAPCVVCRGVGNTPQNILCPVDRHSTIAAASSIARFFPPKSCANVDLKIT